MTFRGLLFFILGFCIVFVIGLWAVKVYADDAPIIKNIRTVKVGPPILTSTAIVIHPIKVVPVIVPIMKIEEEQPMSDQVEEAADE